MFYLSGNVSAQFNAISKAIQGKFRNGLNFIEIADVRRLSQFIIETEVFGINTRNTFREIIHHLSQTRFKIERIFVMML